MTFPLLRYKIGLTNSWVFLQAPHNSGPWILHWQGNPRLKWDSILTESGVPYIKGGPGIPLCIKGGPCTGQLYRTRRNLFLSWSYIDARVHMIGPARTSNPRGNSQLAQLITVENWTHCYLDIFVDPGLSLEKLSPSVAAPKNACRVVINT